MKIRNLIYSGILTLLTPWAAHSQEFLFKVSSAYAFPTAFDIDGGRARLSDTHVWMGSIGFTPYEIGGAEIFYSYQPTLLSARSNLFTQGKFTEQVDIHYIMAGSTARYEMTDRLQLSSSLRLGAVVFNPLSAEYSSLSRFAAGFFGGADIFITEHFGFNAGINISMPLIDTQGFIWWSPQGGTQAAVGSTAAFVQFYLSGGLSYRL